MLAAALSPPATRAPWRLPLQDSLDFALPPHLEAGQPPEARGLARDQVRLMVSYRGDDRILLGQFRQLPEFLQAGDLLVINTSATLNAALHAWRADGSPLEVHLSTHLPADLWSLELRLPQGDATQPFYHARAGETLELEGGGTVRLLAAYRSEQRRQPQGEQNVRLWLASLELPLGVHEYLACYGFPIRYQYVQEAWPLSYYQTVYAGEPGSAEMPSAGRAFTPELLTRLVSQGVQIAPVLLHTGVASLEDHEPPYEEYYRIPETTAEAVNAARQAGRRVLAVGTTVVRALETVANPQGRVHPGEGWTRLLVTPERGVYSVDGLLTGLHEPRSTHLAMLSALAGREHLRACYASALQAGLLWHEFGDLHLILP
ncbi:MAG: S-adenosylmethionine:tRNA ribosyltransferase-isomerase [Chloroflexota bacterium]